MMHALALLVALSEGGPATVSAVHLEAEDGRPVLRAVTWGPVMPARVERDGRDLLLTLPGTHAGRGLVAPAAAAGIRYIAVEDAADGLRIRVGLESAVEYDLHQEPGTVRLSIRPLRSTTPRRPPMDVRELYGKILPPPSGAGADNLGQPPLAAAGESGSEPADGLRLGLLRLRPYLVVSFLDVKAAFLDTPEPVHDQYLQIEPHLGLGAGGRLPLPGQGRFQLSYEPRFRAASSFAELRQPSHLATVSLDVPIGASVTLRGGHHFARGFLETTEVDPGREYFFKLAPFTRNQSLVGVTLAPGGLLGLEASASRDSVRIDDESGFFDHRVDRIVSSLTYQFGASSRAYVRYQWDRVPTPAERPVAESQASAVSVGVAGTLMPLVSGDLTVGFRHLTAPRAAAGGDRFRGAILTARVRKELTPSASFTLAGRRETYPSAFEENAFYVSTGAGAETDLGLPLSLVFHGGIGWQRNAYRVPAAGLSTPRRDDIVGWSAGVGRSLTRWGFLRADYRHDRRKSNLAAFESTGHVFLVQIGVGYLGGPPTDVIPQ